MYLITQCISTPSSKRITSLITIPSSPNASDRIALYFLCTRRPRTTLLTSVQSFLTQITCFHRPLHLSLCTCRQYHKIHLQPSYQLHPRFQLTCKRGNKQDEFPLNTKRLLPPPPVQPLLPITPICLYKMRLCVPNMYAQVSPPKHLFLNEICSWIRRFAVFQIHAFPLPDPYHL